MSGGLIIIIHQIDTILPRVRTVYPENLLSFKFGDFCVKLELIINGGY